MRNPYRELRLPPSDFTWTIQVTAAPSIVGEGFDLTRPEDVHRILHQAFPLAYPNEIEVRVLASPDPEAIQKELDHEL